MNIPEITNIEKLAEFLRIDSLTLEEIYSKQGNISNYGHMSLLPPLPNTWYYRIFIPKKNKKLGFRIVYVVRNQNLLDLQKKIQKLLNKIYIPPSYVHGFVKYRNSKTNAELHLGKKYILSIDLFNYFESIKSISVTNMFITIGFTKQISDILTKVITLKNKLVQGFHTSPIVSNIITQSLDQELYQYCIDNNYTYSRYADDITISSNTEIPDIKKISAIIKNNNFSINYKKLRLMKRGKAQYVTGLTVFDSEYPRIPKRYKKQIRLILYYLKKFGLKNYCMYKLKLNDKKLKKDKESRKQLNILAEYCLRNLYGWICYINSIEPIVANKYINEYKKINKRMR